MSEKPFIQILRDGNVYELPKNYHRRSRALTVYREPPVPAVVHSGPLIAGGIALFLVWALFRKD